MKISEFVQKELGLAGLNLKQKAAVIYFVLSLCLLAIPDDSSILLIVLVVANFALSALCVVKSDIKIKTD